MTEPTLSSVRIAREEQIAAVREAERMAQKRLCLEQLVKLGPALEKEYEEAKARKKLLKALRQELAAIEHDDSLNLDDLIETVREVSAAIGERDRVLVSIGIPVAVPCRQAPAALYAS